MVGAEEVVPPSQGGMSVLQALQASVSAASAAYVPGFRRCRFILLYLAGSSLRTTGIRIRMRVGPLAFACDTLIKPELANGPHYIFPCVAIFFCAQAPAAAPSA
jgi:hypothetical protein